MKNERKLNTENDAKSLENPEKTTGEKRRTLQELNLMDDFLFDVATEDLETCKTIIEFATGKRLKSLAWKEGQNDAPLLKSGEVGFDKLQPLEIIMICDFDLYKQGKYRYTFENSCKEVPGLIMGDGCRKIFLNTKGTNPEEVEPELVDFLHYVTESNDQGVSDNSDERLKNLHHKIQQIKASEEMEASFMKTEERERLIMEEGREEMSKLMQILLGKGFYEEAKRAAEDKEYYQQLCEEYDI